MADIGLFGGTFDPVHNGHLQCAAAAIAEAEIAHVIFIPSARPPHKNQKSVCNFEHRLAMLERAVEKCQQFSVSDVERKRSYPSYTIDTWNLFRQNETTSANHFFIIGCDAFLDIKSWYRWQTVLARINFIIVVRPGYDTSGLQILLDQTGFCTTGHVITDWYNRNGKNTIKLLTTETDDISSTQIRRLIRQNKPWTHLVDAQVGSYIREKSLYR
ncbi:MAG: nicotinate-nucleotide adenylyltransferase [Desulfocapsaceae bacterium]|jgi:nicotinate-nucleotide adenylyltransferase|nr:nicotinate-nucleotide adenylyltransferase [Desulfocapsaceae bacterium]